MSATGRASEITRLALIDLEQPRVLARQRLRHAFQASDGDVIREFDLCLANWLGTPVEGVAGELLASLVADGRVLAVGTLRNHADCFCRFLRFVSEEAPAREGGLGGIGRPLLVAYGKHVAADAGRSVSARYKDFNTIANIVSAAFKRSPTDFHAGFSVPAYVGEVPRSGRIKTPEYAASEFEEARSIVRSRVKAVRRRLGERAPGLLARGQSLPARRSWQEFRDWYLRRENSLAFIAAEGPLIGAERLNGMYRNRRQDALEGWQTWDAADLLADLYPTREDIAAIALAIALSEDGALNSSTLVRLGSDCLCDEGDGGNPILPGKARIVVAKARAGITRAYHDVWDRNWTDAPALIRLASLVTQSIRPYAPPEAAGRLMIYLGRSGIRCLSMVDLNRAASRIAEEHAAAHPGSTPVKLLTSRIRPTVISEVSEKQGMEAAQRLAMHASPGQTLAYNLNPGNEKRVARTVGTAHAKALTSIRGGYSILRTGKEIAAAAAEMGVPHEVAEDIIYGRRDKVTNACLDDMASPIDGERPGKRCGSLDSCLLCANAVIQERHLANLIAYRRAMIEAADELPDDEWAERYEAKLFAADHHLAQFDPDLVARLTAEDAAVPRPIPVEVPR